MRIKAINFLYLILGVFGFKSTSASAELFMCSPEILGDATAPRYTDCIDVTSWQWGAGRSVSRPEGLPPVVSAPSFSEVTISKQMDSSSVDLASLLLTSSPIKTLNLYFEECPSCTEGNARAELRMTDVLVSGYSQSTGGSLPSESVSLNYDAVQWCYRTDDMKLECGSYTFP